jgi:3-isopropylmalate/(R)-2-methylmalate dehydratase small subunit
MDKFTVLTGVAAPLVIPNVNTDVLIRVERMLDLAKGQFGPYCFEAWRYREDGSDDPDFVLNQPAYRDARILLAGPNFGCGSSREAAVWSLMDMGFRAVVAPSFGEIFFNNCFQNGVLPVVLPASTVARLAEEAGGVFTVDLVRQVVATPGGFETAFQVDAARRVALLEGLDEIEATFRREAEIQRHQAEDRRNRPWIYDFHP